MSVHVSSWVWRHSRCQGSDLVLLLALADMTNDEGYCWPSIATLAERCRCDERTVYRLLAGARDLGLITIENRSGEGKTSLYRVVTGPPDKVVTGPPDTGVTKPPVTDVRLNHQKRTIIEEPPISPLKGGNGFSAAPQKKKKLTVESVLHDVPADLTLQSPSFSQAWKRWVENRLQLPKATLGAFQIHMAKCAVLGERRAIAAINESIGSSWSSIYERKETIKKYSKPEPSL